MADITLQQAQEKVDQWIKTYGVRYFNELTNMTILTEEVGELARIMARTYGEQSFKESDKNRDLGDEMARCAMGIDLPGKPDRRGPDRSIRKEYAEENQPGQRTTYKQQ